MSLRSVSILILLILPALTRADVKPHALCSDGMVLQQKAMINIWGTAQPGEKVAVSFRDKHANLTADEKGNWIVSLESGVAGGPFPMTIAGKNKLEYKSVFVGEVWICSGQSNMEMPVNACIQADKDFAKSGPANPNLRMFTVGGGQQTTPAADIKGSWVEASKTGGYFSAVGHFFGLDLQKSLNVPVGMIHSSVGGSRIESWISKAALDSQPEVKIIGSPAGLYNGKIHPLLHYTIKGVIWYQGESNADQAYQYRALFPLLIKSWRENWQQGDFPFLFVQLPPYKPVKPVPGDSAWAELREAQALALKLPHTGMAVITDCGDELEVHPSHKRPVGERLSLIARATVYGEKTEYFGPVFKEMKVEGNKAVLSFTHLGGGLELRNLVLTQRPNHKEWRIKEGPASELLGFTMCGDDKKFHPAKAMIVGETVVVTCDAVAKPGAVRYGWADHPVCNLYNKADLPASPFRTDEFPGVTQPKK